MDNILNYERSADDDLYEILGCSELSSEEQILTEYRARVLDCHPDKHPGDASAAERFQRLSKAKEILADPDSRGKYDKWRRSGISMSYDDWCALRGAVHTSMHWATKAPQPQLVAGDEQEPSPAPNPSSAHSQENLSVERDRSPREHSPSPRQASPYHKAHHIDLTTSTKGKSLVTGDQVSWTPQEGSNMLRKFRNYEI